MLTEIRALLSLSFFKVRDGTQKETLYKEFHLLLLVCDEHIALIVFFLIKPAHMDISQSHGKDKYRKENPIGNIHPGEYIKRKPQQINVLTGEKQ